MALNAFESYLLDEYKDSNVVCVNYKYTHSTKQKIDRVSKVPLTNNVINVKIDCYDDKHNLVASHTEKFIDGSIARGGTTSRNKNKALVNIAPAELNNRFAAAKQYIANRIMSEYLVKLNDIQEKIDSLNAYVHCDGVIPNEFVNEPAIGNADGNKVSKNKQFEF